MDDNLDHLYDRDARHVWLAPMVGFLFIVCLMLSAISGHLYMDRAVIAESLRRAEANTRYHQGVAAKLEEQQREEIERLDNTLNTTVWQLQTDLDACRNGKRT
jgi:HAMP domain-containing protein